MIRRTLASVILAGSVLVPAGHFLAGTADAANYQYVDVSCPDSHGSFTVRVNGSGAPGHEITSHEIGVALGFEGNASNAPGLQGRLVSCDSTVGPVQVLFPAGR